MCVYIYIYIYTFQRACTCVLVLYVKCFISKKILPSFKFLFKFKVKI